jgi:hypothetical protein
MRFGIIANALTLGKIQGDQSKELLMQEFVFYTIWKG